MNIRQDVPISQAVMNCKLVKNWGHDFREDLKCLYCDIEWREHQKDPKPCKQQEDK